MGSLYSVIATIHNAIGGLTLLLTIAAALVLLFTARTTSSGSALVLRADLISASVQGTLGVLLIVLGVLIGNGSYIAGLWLHFLLGIAAVGVISAFTARARRSPDSEARRYGGILLGIVVLVLITFLVGQFKYNPLR